MPESEPKPRPLEAVAPGSGQGWKATLRNGKQAVVHEIPVAPAAAAAAAPRVQRLAEHPHPSLSPILAWGTDANGIWVAVEPNEGTPLSSVLARGRFTPHAAAALGLSVLSGIAALHEAGVAMGGFDASAVRLTSNGEVRLAGHPVAAVRGAPSQADLRADVRSCGMAICAAFGVDPSGAPAPPELAPGLVVTMRSMASGAMGPAVDRAQGALREMAGPLLAPDRQLAAQSEIALRAGGREMPSITPFVPEAPKPVVEETPAPRAASYEPQPRSVETYSGLPAQPPRPVETWSPAPAPVPAEPAPPAPLPEPPPVVAAPEPQLREAASWESQPPPQSPAAPEPAFAPSPPPMAPAPPEPAPAPAPEPEPFAPAAYEPPAAPTPPKESGGAPAWTPLETGQWTPGPAPAGHVSSSEWTGEATPVPAPVPPEFTSPRRSSSPAASVTTPPVPRAAAPAPARKPAARRPADDLPSGRPAWVIPAAIGVVILLLLGGGGVFLASRGGSSTTVATSSPHPSPSSKPASPSPTNVLQQVPVYAPGSAAPISNVHFCTAATPCVAPGLPNATDTNCTLGGACSVDVGIFYSPSYGGPVSYVLKFFDRCTGTTTDLPGRSATAGNAQFPKFSVSEVSTSVALPGGSKSVALVVVTQTPAVVQGTPALLLGADSC